MFLCEMCGAVQDALRHQDRVEFEYGHARDKSAVTEEVLDYAGIVRGYKELARKPAKVTAVLEFRWTTDICDSCVLKCLREFASRHGLKMQE